VNDSFIKYKLIILSLFFGVCQLILWLPDIIDWVKTHCWFDDSLPYATNSPGGQVMVSIITLYFLSIITHIWTQYDSIVMGIFVTFITFNNVTTGISLLSIFLINKNIDTK
jgi:hypothetical protein